MRRGESSHVCGISTGAVLGMLLSCSYSMSCSAHVSCLDLTDSVAVEATHAQIGETDMLLHLDPAVRNGQMFGELGLGQPGLV